MRTLTLSSQAASSACNLYKVMVIFELVPFRLCVVRRDSTVVVDGGCWSWWQRRSHWCRSELGHLEHRFEWTKHEFCVGWW